MESGYNLKLRISRCRTNENVEDDLLENGFKTRDIRLKREDNVEDVWNLYSEIQ